MAFRILPAAVACLLLAACGVAEQPASPSPSPTDADHGSLAVAALLPADAVPPAPPGDAVVDDGGPTEVAVVDEPSVQYQPCTMLEITDVPGPPEPGAAAGAVSIFVTGVAQVSQYAIVYQDQAAAQAALQRAETMARDCDPALRFHSTSDLIDAQAVVAPAPDGVAGYRVDISRTYPAGESTQVAAALRDGAVVLYLEAMETGAPTDSGWDADGVLDPAWAEDLISSAAQHLRAS